MTDDPPAVFVGPIIIHADEPQPIPDQVVQMHHLPTPRKRRGPYRDLSGQTFGKLTVIGITDYKNSNYHWECRCSCGRECVAQGSKLVGGFKKQCPACGHQNGATKRTTYPHDEIGSLLGQGLSQYAVAAKVGCSQGAVSWIALGKLGIRRRKRKGVVDL